jgi:tRNA dimethylallyltransferase
MDNFKQIAIIAPTASGKTAHSIQLAHKTNSIILSLDSLAIYKEIDIASAKPTIKEQDGIVHFGIDTIYPNEDFDVIKFIDYYEQSKKYALKNNKNLIIVGGTGFYLKMLLDGISQVPKITNDTKKWVDVQLENLEDAYNLLVDIDNTYASKIASNDKYRIEKALCIYKQTSLPPSIYFEQNKPKPIIEDIEIYEIKRDVEELRKRIKLRTSLMLKAGLIDEVIYLEKKYSREPNCMSSIGIVETLEYLDGKINKLELEEKIMINTARLAKRQRTFNKGQFNL